MKHHLFLGLAALTLLLGCKKDDMSYADNNNIQTGNAPSPAGPKIQARYSGPDYSQPITVELANVMIQSYLNSVNYPNTDSELRSFTFDADSLRAYLNNNNITTVKFMLAHKKSYIDSGNYGVHAGMKPAALTMVLVGLDASDNYILNNRGMVYDHVYPCPANCPTNSAIIQ